MLKLDALSEQAINTQNKCDLFWKEDFLPQSLYIEKFQEWGDMVDDFILRKNVKPLKEFRKVNTFVPVKI